MKLVIIDHEPYRKYKNGRYHFDFFVQAGFEIEYWNIYPAFKYSAVEFNIVNTPEGPFTLIDFNNSDELLNSIEDLDPTQTLICLEVWFRWETLNLFRLIKKRRFNVFAIDYFINHPAVAFVSRSDRVLNFLKNGEFITIISRAWNLLGHKIKLIARNFFNPISIIFVTGSKIDNFYPGIKKKSISYFDVFSYLQSLKEPRLIDEEYIVFLDDYLPYHPDFIRVGKDLISPEPYYKKLNEAFTKIERITGMKIVIAAHPKSNYNNEFDGRTVITGKTAILVKDCQMVLAHISSSINYAVLAEKKILLIYSNDFINTTSILESVFQNMKSYQRLLQAEMINIDMDFNLNDSKMVEVELYDIYKKDYLFAIDYPKDNCEIIIDELVSCFKGIKID